MSISIKITELITCEKNITTNDNATENITVLGGVNGNKVFPTKGKKNLIGLHNKLNRTTITTYLAGMNGNKPTAFQLS